MVVMAQRRWVNTTQPQTLQGAVVFSYLNAALALLFTVFLGLSPFLYVFVLLAIAAFGIAQEKRIAYWAGVVLAGLYLLGELALLDRKPRSATVVADTDMVLLTMSQREFTGLLEDVPPLGRKLLAAMSERLREADSKVSALISH